MYVLCEIRLLLDIMERHFGKSNESVHAADGTANRNNKHCKCSVTVVVDYTDVIKQLAM